MSELGRESAFGGGEIDPHYLKVYTDYANWLPEDQVIYCGGGRLLPIEDYVLPEEYPDADAINAAEDARIQRSYLDYVVSLPEERANEAAKQLLGINNWSEVVREMHTEMKGILRDEI